MSERPNEQTGRGAGAGRRTPGLSRRDFLRVSGTLSASMAMMAAGCQTPVEQIVPFHERPEGLRTPGRPRFYATVLDGAPALVRTREGRPILVNPHPAHPSGIGLTVRHHAALLDLYDPDRARGPFSVRRGDGPPVPSSWKAVGGEVVRALKAGRGRSALVVRPLRGPAERALVEHVARALGVRVVEWDPLQPDHAAAGAARAFGGPRATRPRLERADLVVGFGAEFLDVPTDGLEAAFATRRDPLGDPGMSRFVQFEGRLSLTGANADRRVRVRDSQLAAVALSVAHALVVGEKRGPLAGRPAVIDALQPFAPDAVAAATGVAASVIRGVAAELAAAPERAVVLTGATATASPTGEALAAAVALLNHTVGAYGATIEVAPAGAAPAPAAGGLAALAGLVEALRGGAIDTVIIAGCNPVWDAPAALGVEAALAKAKLVVSLNDRIDETTARADYLAPLSHPLEAWSDAAFGDGVASIAQPVIRPLYDTWGLMDVFAVWGAAAGVGDAVAEAAAAATPPETAPDPLSERPTNVSAGYHYLRAWWGRTRLGATPGTPVFEDAWEEALRVGFHAGEGGGAAGSVPFDPAALDLFGAAAPKAAEGIEVTFFPHFTLHDGRSANNGWLQELPDPVTRITWGSWVAVAPRRFDAMGLANGDVLTVTVGDTALALPAYRAAGLHDDEVAVPLGPGRAACGEIGAGTGVNAFPAFPVVAGKALRAGLAATLAATGEREELAIPQGADVIERESRPLVPVARLSEVKADPSAGTEQPPGGPSAWPGWDYDRNRWWMAIDLSKCNGCGKCVIGCNAENNIPVVGKRGVIEGREMQWIRIDRYYDAPKKAEGEGWGDEVWDGPLAVVEEPETVFEPMLCQHCENAPCETVCPFVATMHSEDGLNQQIYNRCVGTRYCANNCPFKVRRFNWFEYSKAQDNWFFNLLVPQLERHAELNTRGRMPLKNNPEVTVRSRGVMEKCSFCVQRIREARAANTREGQEPHRLEDGAVVPACMEACPTGAIVFGDRNDPSSKVRALAENPRAMRLLELTGVKPSISYLTKVRHD